MNGNYHHSRQCTFCNGATASARVRTYTCGNDIVTEASYTCPRCNNLIARDIVNREPKKKVDS